MLEKFFHKFLFRKPDYIKLLKENLIFKGLSYNQILRLEKEYLYQKTYKKEEVVVKYGEPGYALYILVQGKVGIFLPKKKDTGEFIKIDELMPGEFFGEMSLVTDTFRTATVKCLEDSVFFVLSRTAFENIIQQELKIGNIILYNIAGILAKRLKEINEEIAKK